MPGMATSGINTQEIVEKFNVIFGHCYLNLCWIESDRGHIWEKKTKHQRGWRDGSVVKNSSVLAEEPGFNPQHPHSSSEPSVTLIQRIFWCLGTSGMCMVHRHVYKQNICTYKIEII